MNWLTAVSWVAGPALQIILLTFMVQRKAQKVFPRFFSYILFQILKSAVLFATYRFFPDNYFDAYWTGNAISVLLAVAVMDEILHHLLQQYGGMQSLGVTIFRWSCGLLLLLAIVGALYGNAGSADRVVAAVHSFERSVRLMQCGLFVLLMLLCRVLKDSWRQPVFGIALGFGVFASIELILVSAFPFMPESREASISLAKSLAYNGVTMLWIGYLKSAAELAPTRELSPVTGMNLALATADAPGDDSFIVWVEQAVDRVLSRHDWPAPVTQESQAGEGKPAVEDHH